MIRTVIYFTGDKRVVNVSVHVKNNTIVPTVTFIGFLGQKRSFSYFHD